VHHWSRWLRGPKRVRREEKGSIPNQFPDDHDLCRGSREDPTDVAPAFRVGRALQSGEGAVIEANEQKLDRLEAELAEIAD
jgi:hypothetical protein